MRIATFATLTAAVLLAVGAAVWLSDTDAGGTGEGMEPIRQRRAVAADLATALADGRLTLDEAIPAVEEMARADPRWFAGTRTSYRHRGVIRPGAPDREVAARYLLVQVEAVREAAAARGDAARAGALDVRMVALAAEADAVAM